MDFQTPCTHRSIKLNLLEEDIFDFFWDNNHKPANTSQILSRVCPDEEMVDETYRTLQNMVLRGQLVQEKNPYTGSIIYSF